MAIIEAISNGGIYNISGHFLFYLLITLHVCLFVDISPIQKLPTCKLNYIIASLLAATIPSLMTNLFTFKSASNGLIAGTGAAVITSVLVTLSIQRIVNIDVDF